MTMAVGRPREWAARNSDEESGRSATNKTMCDSVPSGTCQLTSETSVEPSPCARVCSCLCERECVVCVSPHGSIVTALTERHQRGEETKRESEREREAPTTQVASAHTAQTARRSQRPQLRKLRATHLGGLNRLYCGLHRLRRNQMLKPTHKAETCERTPSSFFTVSP